MQKIKRKISERSNLLARIGIVVAIMAVTAGLLSQAAFARTTYVITDGDKVVVHTTYATDPAAVLSEAGLTLGDSDTFTAQADGDISEITVNRLQLVQVDHEGQTFEVATYGSTVSGVLEQLGIEPQADVVSLPLDMPTRNGMVIAVAQRTYETETSIRTKPFETVYYTDSTLEVGQQRVLTPGKDGSVERTERVTYDDGVEVARTVVEERVLIPAVDQVVARGIDRSNKEQEGADRVYSSFLNSMGVGSTSSPGAAGAVVADDGKSITTAGGEVIPYVRKLAVEATAYSCENWPGGAGITAVGTTARYGAIAVDPTVIPYGTEMYIVSDDGVYIYGYATAEDCGNFRGKAIDLYFNTEDECWIFGRRACTVYILG